MKIKNFILGVGILVVYALVLWQGIQAFYPQPEFDDFCENGFERPFPRGIDVECGFDADLEDRRNSCERAKGLFRYEYDENGCAIGGGCDECNINYNEARDEYSRNIFIISLIIGVVTFALGFFILSIEPVGSALLGSGIWAIFYGTVWNWRNFSNIVRFVLLLIVLVALIWVAIRLNRKKRKR